MLVFKTTRNFHINWVTVHPQLNLSRNLNLAVVDFCLQVLRILLVYCATYRNASTQDFLNSSSQFFGHGSWGHDLGDFDHVVKRNVAIVLDVLDLLPVPLRLLQSLDHKGSSTGNDCNLGLTILHSELDCHSQTLPVSSGLLGNILTDLLG